ncbi:MAG: hypothetical protein SH821_10475 [Phototrophicales bacterium]|jgi:hypothetical protein|nr:hypothetical protein [Phototrophicales bacterium]
MLKRIDRSPLLLRLLAWLSNSLAKQRGLLPVIGVSLVIVSLVVQTINVSANSMVLEYIGVLAHHIGVLIALIGILLSNPLGK